MRSRDLLEAIFSFSSTVSSHVYNLLSMFNLRYCFISLVVLFCSVLLYYNIEMLYSLLYILFNVFTSSATRTPPHHVTTTGFSRSAIVRSAGQQATCVTGFINVNVTATQTKLLFTGPANNMATVETFVELQQANSTIYTRTNGGPTEITSSFDIFSKLCVPNNATLLRDGITTVQFLTHGATLDINYWDIAEGYSYVDAAAARGYATFSYDRLGVGKSEHPDPIQIVQAPIQVEVAHRLVQLLRSGLGGYAFKKVVGVGHSAGSTYTQGVSTKYPEDFNAVIISGTSTEITYVGASVAAFDIISANTDPSGRFDGIANGYFTQGVNSPQSIQFSFFRYPFFDPKSTTLFTQFVGEYIDIAAVLDIQYSQKQTNTIGELLTLGGINTPSPGFTGPVDVLLGQNDFPFCGGDCTYPVDQAAAALKAFYPAAKQTSTSFLVPNSGHNINAHFSASTAFTQMLNFLESNGIR